MDIFARMKIFRPTRLVFLCCVAFLAIAHGELFAQQSAQFREPGQPALRYLKPSMMSVLNQSPADDPVMQKVTTDSTIRQVSFLGSVPPEVLEEGSSLEENRQWAEALTFYQQALREYPDDAKL